MNRKTIVSAILAITMSTGGLAFGQGSGERNDRGRNERAQDNGQQDHRDSRQSNGREPQGRGQNDGQRDGQRGAGPNHQFRQGDRLPAEYRNRQYVVDDWRGHQLSAPPRGYHWVQSGGDYILVAIATGVILQLLLNH